jgi:ankyrin repeat protein
MKKSIKTSTSTAKPNITLGVTDYICLIKLMTYRLSIPFEYEIQRFNGPRDQRLYRDTITYLRDGLTQSIKRKIGDAAAKQLFKDLEAICKINDELLTDATLLESRKQKLSKLIGVGEADLERFKAFHTDRLSDEQHISFKENGISTLLNYIQGVIHFDPKKDITQTTEICMGKFPVQVNPVQFAGQFCCRELSVKFFHKLHSIFHEESSPLLTNLHLTNIFDRGINTQVKPQQSLKEHTAPVSLLSYHSNSFYNYLLDALSDMPFLIFYAFEEHTFINFLERHPDKANNAKDNFGMTLLHLTCLFGKLNTCQKLIQNGMGLAATSKNGETPLAIAALHGHADIVCALLEAACIQNLNLNSISLWIIAHNNPKKKVLFQNSISYMMAIYGDLKMAKLIIEKSGGDPNDILQHALKSNDENLIKELLKNDIETTLFTVFCALKHSSLEIIKMITSKYREEEISLSGLVAEICTIDMEQGYTTEIVEKVIALYPEFSSGEKAYKLFRSALSMQSSIITTRLLGLGVNWRPNDELGQDLLYLAMDSSSKIFYLLLKNGAYFKDPFAALQRAIQIDNPKICQIILDQHLLRNIDQECATNLLYQLLESFALEISLHDSILNLKAAYSLTTILLMNLPDSTKIKFIDQADEAAIQKPHKLDDGQTFTLQDHIGELAFSDALMTQLKNKKIVVTEPEEKPDMTATGSIYLPELLSHNIPNADLMILIPKISSADNAMAVIKEFLNERDQLLEQLRRCLPTKDFQNYPLSGLRSNVAKYLQPITPYASAISPLMQFSVYRSNPSDWIYLETFHYSSIVEQFKLAKARLGFNHYVLCSNLESTIRNYDATNNLAEFKGLTTSEHVLTSARIKMIREKAFQVTIEINSETFTLDAPAELKVKSSDARLLLAELKCALPGAATIFIPVYYLTKGIHDNRYKQGNVFSGGSLTIKTLPTSDSLNEKTTPIPTKL